MTNQIQKDPKTMQITFIGDSITLGYALPDRNDRFTTVLAGRYGFKEDNQGITGTLVANAGLNNNDRNSYIARKELIRRSDLCVIFGGTNDYFWSDKPIDPPEGKENDDSYFTVALRHLCDFAGKNRRSGTTLLVTPYRHFGCGNFEGGSDFRDANNHPTTAVNFNGHRLEDYVNKIVEIGKSFGIPVLDLYHADGFVYQTMTVDGCHPNTEGHRWLADRIGTELEKLFARFSLKTAVLPVPKTASFSEDRTCRPDFSDIRADVLLAPAAGAAQAYARRLSLSGNIPVTLSFDAGIAAEGYRLKITPEDCTVSSSDVPGAHHGLAALLQLADANAGEVPCGEVYSAPDCEYRGVMIDLARNWHPFSFLKEYVDMCWLYGIETLHLHFTDDQSYTLPSKAFPLISTEGRHYTFDEIAELDRYAAERGVQIMPEIDVPGHCTSHQKNYGEIFGTNGIISQTRTSMDAMQTLFTELCEMFPHSKRIHVGGDEAEILRWTEDEGNRDYALSCGIDFDIADKAYLSERLLANFVEKMADAVLACGREPVAWEGFRKCVNDHVSRKILLMSWENYCQTTPELLAADYRIINASWKPMYVVTPNAYWTVKEVYDWSIYRWEPVHPQSPYLGRVLQIEPDDRVRGGQLLAWGDTIFAAFPTVLEGIREEQRLVEERAVILSERTWNKTAALSADDFLPLAEEAFALLQRIKG